MDELKNSPMGSPPWTVFYVCRAMTLVLKGPAPY
jgi:hypothetical protein